MPPRQVVELDERLRSRGVDNQHVDGTELLRHLRDHFGDGGLVADIGPKQGRGAAGLENPIVDLLGLLRTAEAVDGRARPQAASLRAIAAPRPREAPVTRAVFSCKSCVIPISFRA